MKDKYMLEIYYPGGHDTVMGYFTSDVPFQAIGEGDVINPFGFPDADQTENLRVTSVEHISPPVHSALGDALCQNRER